MSTAPVPSAALEERVAKLRQDTVSFPGKLLTELQGVRVGPGEEFVGKDAFLMRDEAGFSLCYRKHGRVEVSPVKDDQLNSVALYLAGTVYAVAACHHGFFPMHASAVARNGRVIAFSGPSGAGKSTLVAGLGMRGWPMFCDDTLILDLSADDGSVWCLPGHKRLKLWPDSLSLTGAEGQELVSASYPKYFVSSDGGDIDTLLPLDRLVFLEDGDDLRFERATIGQGILLLDDDHYTRGFFEAINGITLAEKFALLTKLAAKLEIFRFSRPKDPARFSETTSFLEQHLEAIA